MKVALLSLVLFLLAFAGLAAGLILRRPGLRGGCNPTPDISHDCQCKPPAEPALPTANSSTDEPRECCRDNHCHPSDPEQAHHGTSPAGARRDPGSSS